MQNNRHNLVIGMVSIILAAGITLTVRVVLTALPIHYQLIPQIDVILTYTMLSSYSRNINPLMLCAIGMTTDILSGSLCGLSVLSSVLSAETITEKDDKLAIFIKTVVVSNLVKWGALSLMQLGIFSPKLTLLSLVSTLIVYWPVHLVAKTAYDHLQSNNNIRIGDEQAQ